ncbi:MAG: glycosyl amidation-associated protein WbuZ [bacterium]
MLKKRVIPCLLLKDLKLIKSIQFGQYRNIGSYIAAVTVFNARDVDELVFLDISASADHRDPLYPLISDVARECFMPLAVGGGVRTMDHITGLLQVGADKVVLNTAALDNPDFITAGADRFGVQCIVVSIDAKKTANGYEVYRENGQRPTGKNVVEWAKEVEKRGAGEIFLTSIDHDGVMEGYDIELTRQVAQAVNIPVIASGGAGKLQDFVDVISNGFADAVAAASIFQYTQCRPHDIKEYLVNHGIPARL